MIRLDTTADSPSGPNTSQPTPGSNKQNPTGGIPDHPVIAPYRPFRRVRCIGTYALGLNQGWEHAGWLLTITECRSNIGRHLKGSPLKVTNVTAPSPVGVGEQVVVDVQVENKGNIATSFDLVLRDTTTGVVVETRTVSLAREETAWFEFGWDTAGGSVGDHVLRVEAVVAGDANPGDNVKTKTVKLNSVVYDLKVTNVAAPSPVVKGTVVPVVIDVENKGNIATTFNLILRDTTDNMIVETRTVTVARGSVASFTFEWDSTTVSLGVHVLESEAVLIGDANPGDNKKTKDVTVNA